MSTTARTCRGPLALAVLSSLLAATAACGLFGGKDDAEGETREISGTLVTADGAPADDYLVYGEDESGSGAERSGSFSAEVSNQRSAMLLAVPRPGSATAAKYGQGRGLYLSPTFGSRHLVEDGDGDLALAEGGKGARIDARTTVLATLLLHPQLANPNPAASRQVGSWLVERANRGWPELEAAARAWERAVVAGTDPASSAEVVEAMRALFASLDAALPADLVTSLGSAEDEAQAPTTAFASDGASQISASLDDPAIPTLKLDNAAGTNLDYLCVVRPAGEADFPSGAQSPRFLSPDRRHLASTGAPIRSVFLSAKSYASYLDVIGNGLGLISDLIGGATVGPSQGIPLARGIVTEVRCFSGGYGGAAMSADFDFVQQSFRADARSAFIHNVTAAAIEVFSALPGAENAAQTDVGKDVIRKVVQQAIAEVDAKANSQGFRLEARDVYEVIYNVAKAGLNEFADKSSEQWREGKLKSFFTWGGKGLVKFLNVSGKVANAGAAGSRAYALARPQSLLEYFLVSVDGETANRPDAGGSIWGPDFDVYNQACHRLIDHGCIENSISCPDSSPTQAGHPYHDCAMAAYRCILAGATCDDMAKCKYSVGYHDWPDACP